MDKNHKIPKEFTKRVTVARKSTSPDSKFIFLSFQTMMKGNLSYHEKTVNEGVVLDGAGADGHSAPGSF